MSTETDLRKALLDQLPSSWNHSKFPEPVNFDSTIRTLLPCVPEGSKIILSEACCIILDIGLLSYDIGIGAEVKTSELISFQDIRGVAVTRVGKRYSVTIQRDNANAKNIEFFVEDEDKARAFQMKLSGMTIGKPNFGATSESALDKISKLKSLFDAGAISEKEFEKKKTELLDSI
jgi:hypothetical protein